MGHVLEAFRKDAQICSETLAAYLEAYNLLCELGLSSQDRSSETYLVDITNSPRGSGFVSKALLNNRLGMMALQKATATSNLDALKSCLFEVVNQDVDTACALLEAIPNIWGKTETPLLCKLYLEIVQEASVPEAKAAALTNLAVLMDECLSNGEIPTLPGTGPDPFAETFQHMQDGGINPTLANAILLASGPLVAILAIKAHGEMSFWLFDHRLRAWGKAIADALHDSNTFDMRMAAARAIQSFARAMRTAKTLDYHRSLQPPTTATAAALTLGGEPFGADSSFLPFLLALYTTLVDDDEEIREVGAAATALVMSEASAPQPLPPLVPVDAADALLSWIQTQFGRTNEFKAYVICRLVGNPLITIDIGVQDLQAWRSPRVQFAEALKVDESLFAVEEQNLFIDEVRETERWVRVFRTLEWDYDEIENQGGEEEEKKEEGGSTVTRVLVMDSSLSELQKWTETALGVLAEQQQQQQAAKDDGPLGWASNPAAFALCHRVLACGRVLSELLATGGGDTTTIAPLLDRLREDGRRSRLHGLLLEI